jgi:hypothetical protein
MCVKHVEAFGDSLLAMPQFSCIYQCFDGSLNAYLNKCLEIAIQRVSRDENTMLIDFLFTNGLPFQMFWFSADAQC